MPMWRCPHCGTPQAETARCWVCRRSSTACGTCRHFRRSVAAQLGYCGLDRQRRPLSRRRDPGLLGGWPGTLASHPRRVSRTGPGRPISPDDDRTPVRKLEFVEVQSSRPAAGASAAQRPRRTSALGPNLGLDDATDQPSVTVGAIGPALEPLGRGRPLATLGARPMRPPTTGGQSGRRPPAGLVGPRARPAASRG